MRSIEMLKSLWTGLTSYLLARDIPTSTMSIADGVRKVLTTPLAILQRILVTSAPRLLISVMLIALLLIGALTTWMI